MSELSEEEIARVVRQAMLSNPDGGPFRHRETERSLIASEAARLVLALLQPALERARREERERCAEIAENTSYGRDIDWWLNATKRDVSADACLQVAAAIRKG